MALLNSSSAAALAAKEQALVWLLVRQLGQAQQAPAGQGQLEALWREVAALTIDPDRVITLLYGGHDLSDRISLAALDPGPGHLDGQAPQPGRGRLGLRRRTDPAGGRRSGPRAAAPAHPAGR